MFEKAFIWSVGLKALLSFRLIVSVSNMALLAWKLCHLGAFPLGVKKPIMMPVVDSWHVFIGSDPRLFVLTLAGLQTVIKVSFPSLP